MQQAPPDYFCKDQARPNLHPWPFGQDNASLPFRPGRQIKGDSPSAFSTLCLPPLPQSMHMPRGAALGLTLLGRAEGWTECGAGVGGERVGQQEE